ncbi:MULTISPECIES: hypothetical protein [unclassified Phyllobacterium]|uniref:hypothetical protein n=1 Tax=Phyllobacterium TaxID=28100 RepID=UPI00111363CF|nr:MULTISPECIES: hypothetical protein [unclassified Phyllobacterium]MBA8899347.1 hypothetical protein [Phyllobacterium sp. P30BS-XVII]UGX85370.1 hypothetical protein LLE53_012985 [Phyllobacterium sp. T1293]
MSTGLYGVSAEERPLSRKELCAKFQTQVHQAIIEHAEAPRAAKAKSLQKKAIRFCASNRQAQGVRTFAKALKALGVQPVNN